MLKINKILFFYCCWLISFSAKADCECQVNEGDFIVITPKIFIEELAEYKEYQESQGLNTKIVTIDSILSQFGQGVSPEEAIRIFISSAITNWTIKPKFCLLVGNVNYIPSFVSSSSNCDNI